MEMLILFAIWVGLAFVTLRSTYGAQASGTLNDQTSGENAGAGMPALLRTPPERDIDPVCGKPVRTEHAKPSVHAGMIYYFCSRDCREIFEAAPDLYPGDVDPGSPKLEQSHA